MPTSAVPPSAVPTSAVPTSAVPTSAVPISMVPTYAELRDWTKSCEQPVKQKVPSLMKIPRPVHLSPLLHLPRQRKATTSKPHRLHLLKGAYQHLMLVGAVLLPLNKTRSHEENTM
jgi:hypothetical protein